jgi:Leucine-rich repeat (LRR) protein
MKPPYVLPKPPNPSATKGEVGQFNSNEERNVLSQFYISLNGESWTNHINWQSSEPVCTWNGVSCQANGRVQSLSLPSNNLRGCPSSLVNLTALIDVDLSGNQVTCIPILPNSVNNVYFARNLITEIPESLFTFTNQRNATDISDNPLNGNIHWPSDAALNRISFLYLDRVGLTVLPEKPGFFRDISWLSLDGNLLTDVYLSSCVNMVSLSVSNNKLSSLNVGCTYLQFLHATHNQLVDVSFISSLTTLRWIWLSYNLIEHFPPLSSLSELTFLDLSNNLLSETFTLESNSVSILILNNNRIQCVYFSIATSLTDIRVSNNSLQDICNLAASLPPSVIHLDLSFNEFTFLDFNLTRAPFSILYLDASDNKITRIVSFQNRLVSNQFCFCSSNPNACSRSTTLWLDLSHNLFAGEILEMMHCLIGVVSLDLSNNLGLVSTTLPPSGNPRTSLISLDASSTSALNIFDFPEVMTIRTMFPVLGTLDVSDTPLQCIPSNIDSILPLQFLRAKNVCQPRCENYDELNIDVLALNPRSRVMDLTKSIHCPMYNFVYSKAIFQTDPAFFGFVNCTCPSGMSWDYTKLECIDCTVGVFCNGTVNGRIPVAQDYILKGGYPLDLNSPGELAKPENGTFRDVVVLECLNPDSCNPEELPLFECALGSEGMLCSKCSREFYAHGNHF